MPDSFFATNKPRKRKRSTSAADVSSSRKIARKGASSSRSGLAKANGMQKVKKGRAADEELESDATHESDGGDIDDMDLRAGLDDEEGSEEEDAEETPAEKRLRLARLYLESVKEGLADGEYDAAEIDKEVISARLKQDILGHSGKMHLFVADSFDLTSAPPSLRTRGHRLPVTAATASEDARWLFTAGKEGSIIKWDLSSGSKAASFHKIRPDRKGKGKSKTEVDGHTAEVLALAVSSDGRHLASGGRDRRVGVWDIAADKWLRGFGGHKDYVSALSFRKGSNTLYTASADRTLRLYDLASMGYVETLFGHQDSVVALDALQGETAVSVGGRDKSARWWKIGDDSQLVFRGGGSSKIREVLDRGAMALDEDEVLDDMEVDRDTTRARARKGKEREKKYIEGSVECVAMVDESTFITGGDSGSISLWTITRKKPVFTHALAHGLHATGSETEGVIETPRWITALACLRYSDLFASGSWDGSIHLWKIEPSLRSFSPLGAVALPGVVNALQLLAVPSDALLSWADSQDPSSDRPPGRRRAGQTLLVAGVGQEHRFGRWWKAKEGGAVNGAVVFALRSKS